MSKTDRYKFDDDQEHPTAPLQVSAGDIFKGVPPPPPVPFRKPQGGAILAEGDLTVGAFTLTRTGLQIGERATSEDWTKVGQLLFKLEGSIQWIIGDWLAYGEDVRWGDIPTLAEQLGRDKKTLYNYSNYSRAIQSSLRREDLSYTHHMLISGLNPEDQKNTLAYAAENGLSVGAFRTFLRDNGFVEARALPAAAEEEIEVLRREVSKLKRLNPAKLKPKDRQAARSKILDYLRHSDRENAELRQIWEIDEE